MNRLPWQSVHFVGIGGVGMSGLATVLLDRGIRVSGTDSADSAPLRRLRARGAAVRIGHSADALPADTDVLVFSSAVPDDNPELRKACECGIRRARRGVFLAELAQSFDVVVSVAGSHGKTTTSAMIAHILRSAGLRPGYLVGGEVEGWPAPAAAGSGRILVTEVDESDGTQAHMRSSHAVVTNVDDDHCWSVGGIDALRRCFAEFASRARTLHVWQDPGSAALIAGHADAHALTDDDIPQELDLPVPGEYNRRNATLALSLAARLGVARGDALAALRSFPGVVRRLTTHFRSHDGRVVLIEDYAHHPVELRSLLDALRTRYPEHRLLAIFQPHRFERIKRYTPEFAKILGAADEVVVTQPFAAWVQDGDLADPKRIADLVTRVPALFWEGALCELSERVCASVAEGGQTLVAVIGAGSIGELVPLLRDRLADVDADDCLREMTRRLPHVSLERGRSWANMTTLGVGTARPLVASPGTVEELRAVLRCSRDMRLRVMVVGAGSNLVGTDDPTPCVALRLSEGKFRRLDTGAESVVVGAGVPLPRLCRTLANAGRLPARAAGLAWIPGTVGGAIVMNAGTDGAEMGQFVRRVTGVTLRGETWEKSGDDIEWRYRSTSIPADVVVCAVELRFPCEECGRAPRRITSLGKRRRRTQPGGPSAGCGFRNPGRGSAGRLLDACGCRGMSTGGIALSDVHANFLIRVSAAAERDVVDLMTRARWQVFNRTGVVLSPEVKMVSERSSQQVSGSIEPLHVAVLKGGPSSEREVSIRSAAAVSAALQDAGHVVTEIELIDRTMPELPPTTDVVFPVLHGEFGEDGEIQALMESREIPFVASGSEASALIMDKAATKELLLRNGIGTARYLKVTDRGAPFPEGMEPPLIVKPCSRGSSVGLTKLNTRSTSWWRRALNKAFAVDDVVLVEEFLPGAELTVGILAGTALPTIEIVPPNGRCYDYDAKYEYKQGHTDYLCPPKSPAARAASAQMQEIALQAYTLLGARDMLRVDFRLDTSGDPMVLEANSIPGFTSTSLLPKAAAEAGISFVELCARLVKMAYDRARLGLPV